MDYRSDMIRTTEKYLVVHFTEKRGTTVRHSTVKVPLSEIVISASAMEGLDRATRRVLLEHWSGLEIGDTPLW